MLDLTDTFIKVARRDGDFARAVRTAAASYRGDEEAYVDSQRLHSDARPDLGLTYVQFALREAPHVCRHTIGESRYRVHSAEECSAVCDLKWQHQAPATRVASAPCPTCYLTSPLSVTECPACDTPLGAAA